MTSPAIFGTRPQRPREPAYDSNRNTLRASVLDVALELGIGTSRAVENLIFDSVLEEDEVSVVSVLASASHQYALAFSVTFDLSYSILGGSCHIYDTLSDNRRLRCFSFCAQHSKCPCPSKPRSPVRSGVMSGVPVPGLCLPPSRHRILYWAIGLRS